MIQVKTSINQLLDIIFMSGDLGVTINTKALQRGIRVHQQYQEQFNEHEIEVRLDLQYEKNDIKIDLNGRVDLLCEEDGKMVIKELKSTDSLSKYETEYSKRHLLQAIFYGYMYCMNNNLNEIKLEVIYIEEKTLKTKVYDFMYTLVQLESEISEIIEKYIQWVKFLNKIATEKQQAVNSSIFPFPEYRKYQKKLMREVYLCNENEEIMLVNAPTGIGKSISVLLPSIKSLQSDTDKVIYLTAKNTGKESFKKAITDLDIKAGKIRSVVITAKEKICINDEFKCEAEKCPYAKNFFDGIVDVIQDIFNNETLIYDDILKKYAKKHTKCPFELSLLLAEHAGIVCADFNNYFDPLAKIHSFFEVEKRDILLVDEAHNLYKRVCGMYTDVISPEIFVKAKENAPKQIKKEIFDVIIDEINYITETKNKENNIVLSEYELLNALEKLYYRIDKLITGETKTTINSEFKDFYFFYLKKLFRILETYNSNFRTYISDDNPKSIRLECLLPNDIITEKVKFAKSSVFFSGTLLPINYYNDLLITESEVSKLLIPPIFPQENLKLSVLEYISTKYTQREKTKMDLSKSISKFIENTTGNTIVFFSSFVYMNLIYDELNSQLKDKILIQDNKMSDFEKRLFIENFKNSEDRKIGFAVLGGVFSEGVDYIGKMLENVVIVGIGLPTFNSEHKYKTSFFEEKFSKGYKYASLYVGLGKVLQAIGRVIRTEEDKGSVLLIDERYSTNEVKSLIFSYWQNCTFYSKKEYFYNKIGKNT